MIVGISNDKYPEKRTIIVNNNVEYVNFKTNNFYYYINLLNMKVLHKRKNFIFKPLRTTGKDRVDIFHLFNEVALTSRKWIATFETELPRILPQKSGNKSDNFPELDRLAPALVANNCLALIALSGAAYQMEKRLFERLPEVGEAIMGKTVVMHPPQALHVTHREKRLAQNPLHFVFIGNEFYRKGGGEVVRAFSELVEERLLQPEQVRVTLIGDLEKRVNYAHGQHQDDPFFSKETEKLISQHSLFEHQGFMPNDQVLSLLQRADVGLLPTWAETYGFSVLEMQSCGCPVITSNVRALPEINPVTAGWQVINPLDEDLDYRVTSVQVRDALRQRIITQLKTTILSIVQDPEQIGVKAAAAIERIKTEHDISAYQQKLQALYARQGASL
ncbi:glycosyltransferase family 4 protein [Erwinia sp. E_sp_B04_7]|uniref:glycosyltransferase family 4 protein n=1 Tax=unclassified Erwinia TaxID=2622719 RepID=UPI0030D404C6